jgi:hypothetical protein
MRTLTSLALAAGLAMTLSTAANAAATLVGTTTDPTGIDGLVVDGTTYNVTFSLTTLNTFTYSTSLSFDARTALVDALNSLNVTGLGGASPTYSFGLDLDNTVTGTFDAAGCFVTCSAGAWFDGVGGPDNLGYTYFGDLSVYVQAADFTAVTDAGGGGVPEPAMWAMLLAGFFGIGAMARRVRRSGSGAVLA